MSPCFRAVCRCAQGERWPIGEEGHIKITKAKNKQKLKEEFANDLVWFPVVVTVRGDLTTYDQPGGSFVRVTYLDKLSDDPTKCHPGWLMDKASLTAEPAREVSIACDEQYQLDETSKRSLAGHVATSSPIPRANAADTDGHRTLR